MTDEELKNIWHKTAAPAIVNADEATLNKEMADKLSVFDRGIRNRDIRENISAAFVMIVFAIIFFKVEPVMARVAAMLIVLWAAFTIVVTMATRRHRVSDTSLPLSEYLLKSRDYIIKEKQLLDNILWWYILPAWIGISLFGFGYSNWITIAGGTIMGVLIYMLNKYAANKYMAPLLEQINTEIDNLLEK